MYSHSECLKIIVSRRTQGIINAGSPLIIGGPRELVLITLSGTYFVVGSSTPLIDMLINISVCFIVMPYSPTGD